MRKSFLNWLFTVVFIIFAVVYALCFWVQSYRAIQIANAEIDRNIDDARKEIANNDENKATILAMFSKEAITKARTLARIVAIDPAALTQPRQMEKITRDLDVDEIHVSDEKGILIATYPPDYVGYDMNSSDQSRPFMEAIHNSRFQLLQEPRPNGRYGTNIQYAGVARTDKPGIIQIGYLPSRLQRTAMLADIEKLAPGFRFGNHGKILVCEEHSNGQVIVGADDRSWIGHSLQEYGFDPKQTGESIGNFTTTIHAARYHCMFERYKNYVIMGIMPEKDVYKSRNNSLFGLTILYIVLFLAVLAVVSRLVDRVVIDGIIKITDSLKRITAGDLTEKVSVHTNPEFSLLSNGINSTVGALREAIAKEAARLDRELQLARQIQTSALPRIFPPYPHRHDFEIYATMDTAKEVGGDFYDFCLVDEDHLAFLIADVSGKGVPAALFMMTAKTIIRNYTENGMTPAEIFTKANQYLYENNDVAMFVTAFIGILELSTGKLSCCSAGHNPPLLRSDAGLTHTPGGPFMYQ